MTMMYYNYNTDYNTDVKEPEWMRAERYDYCDGGVSSFIDHNNQLCLADYLSKIFGRIFYNNIEIAE